MHRRVRERAGTALATPRHPSCHGVLFTPDKPDGQIRGEIDSRPVSLLVPTD